MHGRPKVPERVVINFVSNLGSFFPYQYPMAIVKNTGNSTLNSLNIKSIYSAIFPSSAGEVILASNSLKRL